MKVTAYKRWLADLLYLKTSDPLPMQHEGWFKKSGWTVALTA
jgi:hypothetical protein